MASVYSAQAGTLPVRGLAAYTSAAFHPFLLMSVICKFLLFVAIVSVG